MYPVIYNIDPCILHLIHFSSTGWLIIFNNLSGDSGQWSPYSPYKPCNHSLYIGIIIFPHIDFSSTELLTLSNPFIYPHHSAVSFRWKINMFRHFISLLNNYTIQMVEIQSKDLLITPGVMLTDSNANHQQLDIIRYYFDIVSLMIPRCSTEGLIVYMPKPQQIFNHSANNFTRAFSWKKVFPFRLKAY